MERPLIGIYDFETKEQTVRPMNDEEYATYLVNMNAVIESTPAEG
jgi:hypothetical protein